MKRFSVTTSVVALLGLIGAVYQTPATSLHAGAAGANATNSGATRNVPRVTRANFVSLAMQTSGGIANIETQVLIRGNLISLVKSAGSRGGYSGPEWSRPRPDTIESALSNDQLDALLRLLNEIRFPNLAGKYRQRNLADGINEVVVLKVSNAANRDQTFVVDNYGNTAPRAYYRLTRYLDQLVQQKFNERPNSPSTTPAITRANFESLEMRASGGIANIRTRITVRDGAVTWNQSRPGVQQEKRATLTRAELDDLLRVLNEARFPALAGKYHQRNLADGINETVTLSLRGEAQPFVVENYGDTAPQSYYRVIEYLGELVQRKFPPEDSDTPTNTPPVGKNPIKPIREWSSSVVDEALMENTPDYIINAAALRRLWNEWQIAGPVPQVDFSRELVVLTTTRGSRLRLMLTLDETGNLEVGGLATRDLRPGFRYVIATVSRAGVKTVNGQELP